MMVMKKAFLQDVTNHVHAYVKYEEFGRRYRAD